VQFSLKIMLFTSAWPIIVIYYQHPFELEHTKLLNSQITYIILPYSMFGTV